MQKLIEFKATANFFQEMGFTQLTPVQELAAPGVIEGKSLYVLAATGTGKTLAYALPLAYRLKLAEQQGERKKVFILSPIKELSEQIYRVFKDLAHHFRLRVRLVVGPRDVDKLKNGDFDIVVGAPGNMEKLYSQGKFPPQELMALVLDEADQLLAEDFLATISIFSNQFSQVLLFSATYPQELKQQLPRLGHPITLLPLTGYHQLQRVETFNIYLAPGEKLAALKFFLKQKGRGAGIIFVNRKEEAILLQEKLLQEGVGKINLIHGGINPADRKQSYHTFLATKGVLIATDIAARGLDIADLSWVLNYDFPSVPIYYLHRSGRAGRGAAGGQVGKVFNFVTRADYAMIGKINLAIKQQRVLHIQQINPRSGKVDGGKKNIAKSDTRKNMQLVRQKKQRDARRKSR